MRRRKGDENNLIVVTIGVGIILVSLAMLGWGPYSLSYPQATSPQPLLFGDIAVDRKSVWVWVATAASLLAFQYFLRRTRAGIAVRAAAVDPATATLAGVPLRLMAALSFGLSGALAGIAGVMISSMYYASFELGATGLKSLCAAVIGGFGNLPGAVVGGLLLGIFEAAVSVNISAQFTDMLVYGLLIFFLLVRPQGLFGKVQRKV
jgi:branched-chain amino acid transport system permease protein